MPAGAGSERGHMNSNEVLHILEQVKNSSLSPREALRKLRMEPFENLGFARVDHHRQIRQGAGEVIYGAGKTPDQIVSIAAALLKGGAPAVLVTRMPEETAEAVKKKQPLTYCREARVGIIGEPPEERCGCVVVATGGTSDIPVAEEAALTAEFLGNRVERLYDVGVAGLHRLLDKLPVLMEARSVVAIAGMEGALASVIGGLVACPVIGVPTSVGYGASFQGVAALLSMLNSCASGVSVVNIDNGFGAGYLAGMINRMGVA